MEPPNPNLQMKYEAAIAVPAPNVSAADIGQYERLLAQRFQADPDLPRDPAAQADEDERDRQIRDLSRKIFGPAHPGVSRP